MQFLKNAVGRKILMALTGLMMLLFIMLHLLGNASIYKGPDGINAYAGMLNNIQPFIWIVRLAMLTFFSLHVFFGIKLTLENQKAKKLTYSVKKNLSATFASRNMIWTGLVIAAYLVYHLMHFTIHIIRPEISAAKNLDTSGRPDVFIMVVRSFNDAVVSLVYIIAVSALFLHLTHGIQSLFQTLGLNNDRAMPFIIKTGRITAVILFLGYVSIPIAVLAGVLRH